MSGPKMMIALVVVAMLSVFGYIAVQSRQLSAAEAAGPTSHTSQIERAISDTEANK